MKGYAGKYLTVDLTRGKTSIGRVEESMAINYIGGYGFGARTLYDMLPNPAQIDPLSPENVLIWWTGPLAGTISTAGNKYSVFAKSPLTGIFGFGISSGLFASELKSA
ncbi:MAG: aldehyde ferredoxin oxidoreductase N-terminal domain-containing protein, partial [Thermoproteota archaeon]